MVCQCDKLYFNQNSLKFEHFRHIFFTQRITFLAILIACSEKSTYVTRCRATIEIMRLNLSVQSGKFLSAGHMKATQTYVKIIRIVKTK